MRILSLLFSHNCRFSWASFFLFFLFIHAFHLHWQKWWWWVRCIPSFLKLVYLQWIEWRITFGFSLPLSFVTQTLCDQLCMQVCVCGCVYCLEYIFITQFLFPLFGPCPAVWRVWGLAISLFLQSKSLLKNSFPLSIVEFRNHSQATSSSFSSSFSSSSFFVFRPTLILSYLFPFSFVWPLLYTGPTRLVVLCVCVSLSFMSSFLLDYCSLLGSDFFVSLLFPLTLFLWLCRLF